MAVNSPDFHILGFCYSLSSSVVGKGGISQSAVIAYLRVVSQIWNIQCLTNVHDKRSLVAPSMCKLSIGIFFVQIPPYLDNIWMEENFC